MSDLNDWLSERERHRGFAMPWFPQDGKLPNVIDCGGQRVARCDWDGDASRNECRWNAEFIADAATTRDTLIALVRKLIEQRDHAIWHMNDRVDDEMRWNPLSPSDFVQHAALNTQNSDNANAELLAIIQEAK